MKNIFNKSIAFMAVSISFFLIFSSMTFAAAPKIGKITLKSTAFKNLGSIPVKYAFDQCEIPGAQNISPPLVWKVDSKTAKKIKSFAITVIDPHPVAQNMVHMFTANIPSNQRKFAEGKAQTDLTNGFGLKGWGGPCPPPEDGGHPYVFTIYGLNTERLELDSEKSYTDAEIQNLLAGKILAIRAIYRYP